MATAKDVLAAQKAAEESAPSGPPVTPEEQKSGEYDGEGNRYAAVRKGDADEELVANGITQIPAQPEPQTDDHTGKYVAVARLETDPVTMPGAVVEADLDEETLTGLLVSGAIRRQTKDEVKSK